MTLKSRTKTPPCGWTFTEQSTGWKIKTTSSGKLIEAVIAHRKANKLERSSINEVWEDVEDHICGLLRGKFALWDFCNTKLARPARSQVVAPTATSVSPFPVKGAVPRGTVVKQDLATQKATNAEAKKTGKRPCRTCGKRK